MDLGLFNVSDTYQYVLNQSGANAITLGNGNAVNWNAGGVVALTGDQGIDGFKYFQKAVSAPNVYITNTTTDASLEILGNGSVYLDLTKSPETDYSFRIITDGSNGTSIVTQSGPLVFQPSGAEKMRISSNGNIGINTSSPLSTLDVRGAITNYVGTSGTQVILQNWGWNSNSIARWKPVIESNASFAFYGYDSAGGNPTSRVTIRNDNGNIGIGTSTPTEKLHVAGSIISNNLLLQGDNTNGYVRTTNSSSNLYLGANNAHVLTILANGNVGIGTTTPAYQLQLSTNSAAKPTSTAWTVPSDKRIKKNIRPYTKGLNSLITINPVLYDYNGKINFEQTVNNVGLIAQDIKDEFPECINTFKAKLNTTDKEDTELLNFDSHALTFVLINSIKELKQIIDSQNLRISELESKLL